MGSLSPKKGPSKVTPGKMTPDFRNAKKPPAKKYSTPKYLKSPRRGVPKNMKLINHDETLVVSKYLKENPGAVGRRTFNELPGKPVITMSSWAYSKDAPFELVIRCCGSKYIPPGEVGSKYLLKLIIRTIKNNGIDVNDPEFIQQVVLSLSEYAISGHTDHVEKIFKSSTLIEYLDNYTTKDEVAEIVQQIKTRFYQKESFIKGVASTATEAKPSTVEAKNTADANKVEYLLNLRPIALNKTLRTTGNDAWANGKADAIDNYLATLPVHVGVCYRGMCTDGLSGPLYQSWLVVGNRYMDAAFTTASLSTDVAWRYAGSNPHCRLLFAITSHTGRLIPIGDEQEISFMKATQFRITKVGSYHSSDANNRHVLIHMDEVFDDDL